MHSVSAQHDPLKFPHHPKWPPTVSSCLSWSCLILCRLHNFVMEDKEERNKAFSLNVCCLRKELVHSYCYCVAFCHTMLKCLQCYFPSSLYWRNVFNSLLLYVEHDWIKYNCLTFPILVPSPYQWPWPSIEYWERMQCQCGETCWKLSRRRHID